MQLEANNRLLCKNEFSYHCGFPETGPAEPGTVVQTAAIPSKRGRGRLVLVPPIRQQPSRPIPVTNDCETPPESEIQMGGNRKQSNIQTFNATKTRSGNFCSAHTPTRALPSSSRKLDT